MLEFVGFGFAILGALMSIAGSWYVSSDIKTERRMGFLIWILGNPVNIVVLIGAIIGLWTCMPLIITICLQGYFICTAYRGWKSNE